ncbi:MAG: hypothetical protein ACRD3V_31315 [Vicinamibacteria bacterium]
MIAALDRPTFYAMANRLWGSASGLLTAVLVAAFFTPELQGYYFTFLSLLTLQTFIELGFGELLQQFVSHEWAMISSSDASERERAHDRLSCLVRFSLRYYGSIALVLFIGLGVGGTIYFGTFAKGGEIHWASGWWLAVVATAISVLLVPLFSLLEGANRTEKVHGVRLWQGVASRVSGFLAIALGFGLLTITITRIVSFAAGLAGLGRESFSMIRRLWSRGESQETVSFRQELWPLQWRFALSWLSGYVVYSLFTPVLFAFHGAELAGRMGLTTAAATAISSAAFAVMATRVPRLAILAARRDFPAMDALFRRATIASVGISALGAAVFLGGLGLAHQIGPSLATRFLPIPETALFLSALVLQQVRFAMGSYLRAHKAEPFVMLSALEGMIAIPLFTLLGRQYEAMGMVLGFLGLTTVTLVPAISIFERCRKLWHQPRWAEA